MKRFAVAPGQSTITFTLTDLDGNEISAKSRVRISIFQCIPIIGETASLKRDVDAPAADTITGL